MNERTDRCPNCSHAWHGLPCASIYICECPTAWVDPRDAA